MNASLVLLAAKSQAAQTQLVLTNANVTKDTQVTEQHA
jgi:hypothetical protein